MAKDVDGRVVRVWPVSPQNNRYKFGHRRSSSTSSATGRHGPPAKSTTLPSPQPLLYQKIKETSSALGNLRRRYRRHRRRKPKPKPIPRRIRRLPRKKPEPSSGKPTMRDLPSYWNQYYGGPCTRPRIRSRKPDSRPKKFQDLTQRLTTYPAGFHIHPKVKKLLEQRAARNGRRQACRRLLAWPKSPGLR